LLVALMHLHGARMTARQETETKTETDTETPILTTTSTNSLPFRVSTRGL
jgi:hypothetical protein